MTPRFYRGARAARRRRGCHGRLRAPARPEEPRRRVQLRQHRRPARRTRTWPGRSRRSTPARRTSRSSRSPATSPTTPPTPSSSTTATPPRPPSCRSGPRSATTSTSAAAQPTYAGRIDNYRRHVGPEWYSFDYGNRHFVVFDNCGGAPFDEQREWVERDLEANAPGKRVVVLMHQPMNVPFGSPSAYDEYGELFEHYETELVLVGHEHSNDTDTESDRGRQAHPDELGSYTIDNSPRGFRYVHMARDSFDNPFRMFGVQRALSITSPAPDARVAELDEIQVNAYHTLRRDRARALPARPRRRVARPARVGVLHLVRRAAEGGEAGHAAGTRSRSRPRPRAARAGRARRRSA